MSQGLGQTQRRVLRALKENHDRGYPWGWMKGTVARAYHPERFKPNGDPLPEWMSLGSPDPWECTRAEYVAGHRAVKGLAERGMVECKVEPYTRERGGNWPYGYGRRTKRVRITDKGLSVDVKI